MVDSYIDVIMVWHSYMLNPRNFLQDSIRYGAMHFWCPMPWKIINASIDQLSFQFETTEEGRNLFQSRTGLPWDSLSGPQVARLQCPRCRSDIDSPLTTCTSDADWSARNSGGEGFGFGELNFRGKCGVCALQIDHDVLKSQKVRRDVLALLMDDIPMPGLVLNIESVFAVTMCVPLH